MSDAEAWLRSNLPDWLFAALDKDHRDTTTRGVAADWCEENGKDPLLASCYRFMYVAQKHPAVRKLSHNVDNLMTGFGWFSESLANDQSTVPNLLKPSKDLPRRGGPPREWVWGSLWEAEHWFVTLWTLASPEVRQQLMEEACTPKTTVLTHGFPNENPRSG